jgi:hypothetical protein
LDDFRITILILAPVVVIYLTAFVKDAIKNMRVQNSQPPPIRVTKTFAAIAVIYAGTFGTAVIYTISDFWKSASMTPNELKDALALTEVIGGGFLGLIVDELFGKQEPPAALGQTAPSPPKSS